MSSLSMLERYDLAIVGGGPAGAACALRAASHGLSVALFEAQRGALDKPCGEGLMPQGLAALRALGVERVIGRGRSFASVRYVAPSVEPLEIPLPCAGLALERHELARALDAALARAPGVRIVRAHARAEREGDRFRVRTAARDVVATTLVAADGLHGGAASWLRGGELAPTRRVGARARFVLARELDTVEIHLGRATELYLAPLRSGRITVAVLADARSRASAEELFASALDEHPRARAYLGERTTKPEARALGAPRPRALALDGAFLAGDAGGSIDPILGCGTSLALESGILAADAALRRSRGERDGSPECVYAGAYTRRTRAQRLLASALLGIAHRPLVARALIAVGRRAPGAVAAVTSIAARASDGG